MKCLNRVCTLYMTKFQWQKVENKLERTVAFYKYVDIVKNFIKNLM